MAAAFSLIYFIEPFRFTQRAAVFYPVFYKTDRTVTIVTREIIQEW